MDMKNKFIFFNENAAFIEDYVYYANNEKEIDDWLTLYNSVRTGMTIQFFDEKTKMLFILRWS